MREDKFCSVVMTGDCLVDERLVDERFVDERFVDERFVVDRTFDEDFELFFDEEDLDEADFRGFSVLKSPETDDMATCFRGLVCVWLGLGLGFV
jgi:hypothetical protein